MQCVYHIHWDSFSRRQLSCFTIKNDGCKRMISISEKQMKFYFDLQQLGFPPHINSYFKDLIFTLWMKKSESNSSPKLTSICSSSSFIDSNTNSLKFDKELMKFVEKLDVPNFWINERRMAVVHIVAVLARREKVDYEILSIF